MKVTDLFIYPIKSCRGIRLERAQKGEDALVSSAFSVQQQAALLRGQRAPGCVPGDPFAGCGIAQQLAAPDIARLGPGVDRALRQRLFRVRDDQFFGVLEHGAEAVASRARSTGIIE